MRSAEETQALEKLISKGYRSFYLSPGQVGWMTKELIQEPSLIRPMLKKGLGRLFGLRNDK